MMDGLNVVPVRVDDEGPVVALRVLGSKARGTVVSPSCGNRGRVKRVNLFARIGREGDVQPAGDGVLERDREIVGAVDSECELAHSFAPGAALCKAKRRERLTIEPSAAG